MSLDAGRIVIEAVTPSVDGGRHPVKRIAGEPVEVEADVFRDHTDVVRAVLMHRRKGEKTFTESPLLFVDNDRWRGAFTPDRPGPWEFTVEAWTDEYATWLADLAKRVEAGMEIPSEALEGAAVLRKIARRAKGTDEKALEDAAGALEAAKGAPKKALAVATAERLAGVVSRNQERIGASRYASALPLDVNRERARFGAWYEIFPRSYGETPGAHGTFRSCEKALPRIAAMGFDVLYLTPIHPIGTTARKGRNNTLTAGPDDPGSPWGIGSKAGGHDAVEPRLGTIEDFRHFVKAAASHGLEIALDIAVQASPDHPWVKKHPQWFRHRPDGTIKYAENPPKKYQDIYPVDFDTEDREGLWKEIRRVFLHWVEQGVKIFRVDNPHTKPFPFWHWLIAEVRREHPDVIFLAEAFTRPKVMKGLAKAGFTQSYTYFTWRTWKRELMDYMTELSRSEAAEYFMPNFFANTPDILHEVLQKGGRPAFRMRLVLAATLSPSYGIYSGYELCENAPVREGSEEYLNSEKYEIKARDFSKPGNIVDLVARLNKIRRENPALRHLTNIRHLHAESDAIMAYAKISPVGANRLIVVVNLDPFRTHETTVHVPFEVSGAHRYEVVDLLTGARWTWGERNFVRLDPHHEPAHVLRIERRVT